jgi:hypothetical protein
VSICITFEGGPLDGQIQDHAGDRPPLGITVYPPVRIPTTDMAYEPDPGVGGSVQVRFEDHFWVYRRQDDAAGEPVRVDGAVLYRVDTDSDLVRALTKERQTAVNLALRSAIRTALGERPAVGR